MPRLGPGARALDETPLASHFASVIPLGDQSASLAAARSCDSWPSNRCSAHRQHRVTYGRGIEAVSAAEVPLERPAAAARRRCLAGISWITARYSSSTSSRRIAAPSGSPAGVKQRVGTRLQPRATPRSTRPSLPGAAPLSGCRTLVGDDSVYRPGPRAGTPPSNDGRPALPSRSSAACTRLWPLHVAHHAVACHLQLATGRSRSR